MTFLREAPGETIVVHAARANHAPVQIPATVVSSELVGLVGTEHLRAGADGMITFPADWPAFGMWRVSDV